VSSVVVEVVDEDETVEELVEEDVTLAGNASINGGDRTFWFGFLSDFGSDFRVKNRDEPDLLIPCFSGSFQLNRHYTTAFPDNPLLNYVGYIENEY